MAKDNVMNSSSSSSDNEEENEGKEILTREKFSELYNEPEYPNFDYDEILENEENIHLSLYKFHKYILNEDTFGEDIEKIKYISMVIDYEHLDEYDFSFLRYLPEAKYIQIDLSGENDFEIAKYYTKLFEILQYINDIKLLTLLSGIIPKKNEEVFTFTREMMKSISTVKYINFTFQTSKERIYLNEDSLLDLHDLEILDGKFALKNLSHNPFRNCNNLKKLNIYCEEVEDNFIENIKSITNLESIKITFENIFTLTRNFFYYLYEDNSESDEEDHDNYLCISLRNAELEINPENNLQYKNLCHLNLLDCIVNFPGTLKEFEYFAESYEDNIFSGTGILFQNTLDRRERKFMDSIHSQFME